MTGPGISDGIFEELGALDRSALMKRLMEELFEISELMGTTTASIVHRAGIEWERFSLIRSGKRRMDWSEYMSLLFVLWSDERSHNIVEERGFFPEELKKAMSINRNMHGEKWRYEE